MSVPLPKAKNIARDPRVAVNVVDPDDPYRHFAVRGRVIATAAEGARRASTKSPRSIWVARTSISGASRKRGWLSPSRRTRSRRPCAAESPG